MRDGRIFRKMSEKREFGEKFVKNELEFDLQG